MNSKEIAEMMSAYNNNEMLAWDEIKYGYKKVSKEDCIRYIQEEIEELQEMLKQAQCK